MMRNKNYRIFSCRKRHHTNDGGHGSSMPSAKNVLPMFFPAGAGTGLSLKLCCDKYIVDGLDGIFKIHIADTDYDI